MSRLLSLVLLACGTFALAPPLRAHGLGAVEVRALLEAGGGYRVELAVDLEHLPPGLVPDGVPDEAEARWRALSPRLERAVALAVDGRPATPRRAAASLGQGAASAGARATLLLEGEAPPAARELSFRLDLPVGAYYFELRDAAGETGAGRWLEGGGDGIVLALGAPPAAVAAPSSALRYLRLGFTHIVPLGLDHICFVLGLFFLSLGWRPLLAQVTAFTVAHSLTLGLGLAGLVSLPPALVEPLIALSITCVALENVVARRLHPWRPFVVFAFGLLHGLGFAGVLTEIGLRRGELATALVSFNLGVEAGQVTVLGSAFLLIGLWSARPWYRARVAVPASLAIAAVGLLWTLERIGWL